MNWMCVQDRWLVVIDQGEDILDDPIGCDEHRTVYHDERLRIDLTIQIFSKIIFPCSKWKTRWTKKFLTIDNRYILLYNKKKNSTVWRNLNSHAQCVFCLKVKINKAKDKRLDSDERNKIFRLVYKDSDVFFCWIHKFYKNVNFAQWSLLRIVFIID